MEFNEVKSIVEEFFNGQYEVKKFLGEGSFAEVYLVKHNFLDDLRAMKIIKQPLKSNFHNKEIFHEVMLATQLRGDNIISIYDAGILSNENLAYFVMEYVPGGDLQQYLNSFINSDLLMSINKVLDLIKQILQGLNILHSSNPSIVHRDLKLNNILLSYNSCGDIVLKISDFGIAKEVTSDISDIDIAGTRPYMAPESFNKVVSTMTDIYAIGVIFYQLLTNQIPYDIDEFNLEEILDLKPWKSHIEPPSYYNKNVSNNLDNIVMKCLSINPTERYYDAAELLDDVESIISEYQSMQSNVNDYVGEYCDDYSDFIVNENLLKAFKIAKIEGGLTEACEILEIEVLKDYNIRKYYSETLRMWKSKNPDVKLISMAFTVNLKAKNYQLACSLLAEAIAYNPANKSKYQHYIDLWNIFINLANDGNLIKAVLDLEKLMELNCEIHKIYNNIINTLKTFSIDEIVSEAIRLANSNNLIDASNLIEFAVVCDLKIRNKYSYKLSLWKQNIKSEFKKHHHSDKDMVDYAIDLGTTDSVISYFNNGDPIIIKNHITGEEFTPSAVLVDEDNNVQVGETAKNSLILDINNAVSEFKHNMGFSLPFKFEKSSRILYPEELSAEVLKDLRVSVFSQCGVNIEDVVISIPANSNPIKTRAVNDAARLAGFKSYNLILEPVAVGIAYDLISPRNTDETWLIYDLGGGTFNTSLIKNNDCEIELIATKGLDNLGGNVFDWSIVDNIFSPKIINDLHLTDFNKSNPKYIKIFSKLKQYSEEAKKELSKSITADVYINNLFEGYDFTCTLNREELKEIITPFIKTSFDLCNNLLDENNLLESDIDKIILVGGSCINPIVSQCIDNEYDILVENSINPLTLVSKGAAIYAGNLEKPVLDETQKSFSLIINQDNGRLFSLDNNYLFLGFFIEFIKDDYSLGKIAVNPDGKFTSQNKSGCDIRLYCQDREVDIDYIFKSSNSEVSYNQLKNRYNMLLNRLEDISVKEDRLILYAKRLIEISKNDNIAVKPAESVLNKLKNKLDEAEYNFKFFNLLENVENKLNVVKNDELFDVSNIELDEIIKNKDLTQLTDIYRQLLEKYILINRDEVIQACFFNLRFNGVYTKNQELANNLIKKSLNAFNNDDNDKLFNLINQLYQLDERNGGLK